MLRKRFSEQMKTRWHFQYNYTLAGFAFCELLCNINKMPNLCKVHQGH